MCGYLCVLACRESVKSTKQWKQLAWNGMDHTQKYIKIYKGAVFSFLCFTFTQIVAAALLIDLIHQEYILSSVLESRTFLSLTFHECAIDSEYLRCHKDFFYCSYLLEFFHFSWRSDKMRWLKKYCMSITLSCACALCNNFNGILINFWSF